MIVQLSAHSAWMTKAGALIVAVMAPGSRRWVEDGAAAAQPAPEKKPLERILHWGEVLPPQSASYPAGGGGMGSRGSRMTLFWMRSIRA